MATSHPHVHGPGCGHPAVRHDGHVDYVHDGHLHGRNGSECAIVVDAKHPDACRTHACRAHQPGHQHGPGCGHPQVKHGAHVDYLVEDHLHHPHDGHCDDHGPLSAA